MLNMFILIPDVKCYLVSPIIMSLCQEPCLERKVQEDDLMSITEVPLGLDANEWHALHST